MNIEQTLQAAIRQHQAGRLTEAEQLYQQILLQQPSHPEALQLLGVLKHQQGQSNRAVELIGRAIALRPNSFQAHSNRGEALRVLGRLDEAIADHRRAIAIDPWQAQAHYNLGLALKDNGQLDDAIAAYRQAVALKPDYAKAYCNLGNALRENDQFDEAIAALEKAISLNMDFAEAHSNLGAALRDASRYDEAVAACRQAIALRPEFPEAWSNLGSALHDAGNEDGAVDAYRQAIALKPDFAEAYTNLGTVLKDIGRLDEAVEAARRAVALKPDSPEAHYNLAFILLRRGDFAEGWREYEWRWLFKDFPAHRWSSTKPQWDGSPLGGRSILLYCEQGFGDILQFIRYVPLVAECGGRVIVMCPAELRRLLGSLSDITQFVLFDEPLPEFDVQCPTMSLPLAFGTTPETIPASVPYLRAEPRDIERWRELLAGEPAGREKGTGTFCRNGPKGASHKRFLSPFPGPKVGLVWAGRSTHKNDHNRSLPLSLLAPLGAVPGIHFYSLQKGAPASQAQSPPAGMRLTDWTDELADFADTAALVSNLDLVISVDSAVAHLTGSLGKAVWLLAPHVSDWRWPSGRDDSAWYPTMRVFRQRQSGQWSEVIERVAAELSLIQL